MLATALAPAPSGSLRIASDLEAARRVKAADTDAVLVRRTLPPEVAEAAAARARFGPVLQLRYAFALAQLDADAERGLFAPLGDGPLAVQLRRDAARLARLWGELTGRERAVATLKLVDGDECTKLHADYVDLR
ncbi:MAG TPA: DUF1826 domain-containing protein, partial [Polyangiaceae bacterium LLY-WYZ-15_(1-7)]|nr:DUF1826 domain-containing protein [Polyangiaceae bacterium LLY-WYZ-15_(1-7)]